MLLRIAAALVLVALPALTRAQQPSPNGDTAPAAADSRRVVRATRLAGTTIQLDGRLDETAWRDATPTGDFVQSYPHPNAPAPEGTEVRVLYDDQALYVGIRMYDARPDSIAAQLARRDASGIYSDWVHVIIDSYHDRRTAFRFTVNPRGVMKDVYTSNDGSEDANWDAVWEAATRVDSLGWVAEYRIPFSQLRFGSAAPAAERVWGFQVMRDVARRQERHTWSPWTPQSPGLVSSFGDLRGLIDIPEPRRLELLPYASGKLTRAPARPGDPFYRANNVKPSVGGDVRYGLPGGLTLSATVNPDFGQVEVDPAVVNLSAFETFFPEKRPFFLEGADIFQFGRVATNNDYGSQTFFYSRRVGRQPQRAVGGPAVAFVDAPEATTIAGAAKVTGRAGPWTIGLLDAVTTEQRARVRLDDGGERTEAVEPLTNYFAGRVRRDFRAGQTVVGAMVTSALRDMSDTVFAPLLRSRATFAGVDFEHGINRRRWIVSGFLGGTRVDGSAPVIAATQRNSSHYYQRPDAGYLQLDTTRTSLGGYEGEIALARTGRTYGSLTYKEMSPGFELNDLGFHGRADYRAISTAIGRSSSKAGDLFRSTNVMAYTNHAWNFGGTPIFHQVAGFANATFNSFWSVGVDASAAPRYYSDRLTRGGPRALLPARWRVGANASSDSRRLAIVGADAGYSRDASGADEVAGSLSIDLRPTTSLRVRIGPSLAVLRSTSQYVRAVSDTLATATFGRRYIFADLHQTTLSANTRVEWTFTPTLSLQLFAQPFLSAGRYSAFKEFAAPATFDFAVYGADRGTIARSPAGLYTVDPDGAGPAQSFQLADPTFNVRSLRGNAVLRWEYRPGSALFFVWQQLRSDSQPLGDFDLGRDAGAIFRAPATNVFMVKATYWIGR